MWTDGNAVLFVYRDQPGGMCYDYEVSVLCWAPECAGTTIAPPMGYTGEPSILSTGNKMIRFILITDTFSTCPFH